MASRPKSSRSAGVKKRAAPSPKSSRASRAQQSSPSPADNNGDGDSADAEDDATDATVKPAKPTLPDALRSPTVGRTTSTGRLAGPDLNGGIDQRNNAQENRSAEHDAVRQRMQELSAQGWVPEEEAGLGADDEDDDNAYQGVDDISESDSDEARIHEFEAESMYQEPDMSIWEQHDLARRLSLSAVDGTEWNGFPESLTWTRETSVARPILDLDEDRPPAFLIEEDMIAPDGQNGLPRKVRFQDEQDASDSNSDDESATEVFPDIFVDQDNISSFIHMTDNEQHFDAGSDAGSVYDFDAQEMNFDDSDDSSYDSYESSDDDECMSALRRWQNMMLTFA